MQSRPRNRAVEQSIEIIRRRIDELGTSEPDHPRQGTDRIVIAGRRRERPEQLKDMHRPDRQADLPDGRRDAPRRRKPAAGPGPAGRRARAQRGRLCAAYSSSGARWSRARCWSTPSARLRPADAGGPIVSFRFNATGARRFGDATTQNIGKRFAIVLDNKVISAPVIHERDPRRRGHDHRQLHRRERQRPGHPAAGRRAAGAAEGRGAAHRRRRARRRRGRGRQDLGHRRPSSACWSS